jgi:hypothetical protein
MAGCLSCFTKCSLIPGLCPEYPSNHENKEVRDLMNEEYKNCYIYNRRKAGDKTFYFGEGFHNIDLFRYEIRKAIIFMTKHKGIISNQNLKYNIDLLLYLKFNKQYVLNNDRIPDFEISLFIKWMYKITKQKPKKLLKGKKYEKEKICLYFGKEYLEKLSPKDLIGS